MPAAGCASKRSATAACVVGVDHRGAIRGGDEIVACVEPGDLLDVRLPVVGADDHRVALEELVRPAGGIHQRRDRGVAARERLVRAVRAGGVRGEVVVGEVVDEEVEPVAGDEPTADGGRVRVDRAERAVAHGDRGAGPVALVERVEEEALRAVDRRDAGDRRQMRDACRGST